MNSDEEVCVVCCREIGFYATGPCEHHVCYECSTRMRVLCEQNECPICRSDMPYVIFTHQKKPFSSPQKFSLLNQKYTIAFEDKEVEDAFKHLLEHCCKTCGDTFETFDDLKSHVQRNHCLFYCDLCVGNLKIFTFERKCYTRKDLAYHKRKGDPDDTSHRGHPLCEFCDKRFVDFDELYRHLRREHYYCHFCDADGVQDGHFYKDYSYLKVHFRKKHFLCEEGECAEEKFVVAFRTEIDYKAHKALKHIKNKTKAEAKQARTLDLAFPIKARSSLNDDSSPNHDYRHSRHGMQNNYERKRNMDDDLARNVADESQGTKQTQNKTFNTNCVQDFPLLVNGTLTKGDEHFWESNRYSSCISPDSSHSGKHDKVIAKKDVQIEDFPALSAPANHKVSKIAAKTTVRDGQSQNIQNAVDAHNKKWSKPPFILENNNNEKVKIQNATWRPPKKPLANLDEEFPKLETKVQHSSKVTVLENGPQGECDRPGVPAAEANAVVGHHLYQKCKSKKKQKHTSPEIFEENNAKIEPPALSKLYSGFSNYDVLENENNEDPFKLMNLKLNNKIERLRSERAEEVPWQETVNLVDDDFPPLGPPIATYKCPPGFTSLNTTDVAGVPPGFSGKTKSAQSLNSCVSLCSIAQQLTENSKTESKMAFCYTYEPPSDFQKRNGMLIQQIFKFVNSDNKLFDEFRSLSGNFRKNKISAADYYASCMRILGKEKFLQLFTELLCLLPDINKQQELLTVHNTFLKQDSKKKGAVPKQKGTNKVGLSNSILAVCQTCRQVLIKSDFDSHVAFHRNVSNN